MTKALNLGKNDAERKAARSPFRHSNVMPTDAQERAAFIRDYDRGYSSVRPMPKPRVEDDHPYPLSPAGVPFGHPY